MKSIKYIYEVNLTIEKDAYHKNKEWLIDHFHVMVNQNGFTQLNLFNLINTNPVDDNHLRYQHMVAQYHISDYTILQNYLEKQADQMRSQVFEKLGYTYSVSRRVFELIETFNNVGNHHVE